MILLKELLQPTLMNPATPVSGTPAATSAPTKQLSGDVSKRVEGLGQQTAKIDKDIMNLDAKMAPLLKQKSALQKKKADLEKEKTKLTTESVLTEDEFYKDQLYVKATGANRYAGGSNNWLKIRKIEKGPAPHEFTLFVNIGGQEKEVGVNRNEPSPNLAFKVRSMPASLHTVLMHYFGGPITEAVAPFDPFRELHQWILDTYKGVSIHGLPVIDTDMDNKYFPQRSPTHKILMYNPKRIINSDLFFPFGFEFVFDGGKIYSVHPRQQYTIDQIKQKISGEVKRLQSMSDEEYTQDSMSL